MANLQVTTLDQRIRVEAMMKGLLIRLGIGLAIVSMTACTAIRVQPVDSSAHMLHVCIQENPQVIVADFLPVIREGFDRHAISTELYSGARPAHCEYTLTYTALRSWDLAPFLSHAELRIEKEGRAFASAEYHLRGKGGYSMMKWQSTKAKMDPVMEELLAPKGKAVVSASDVTRNVPAVQPAVAQAPARRSDSEARLLEIQRLKDQGLITNEEYEEKRRAVLNEI